MKCYMMSCTTRLFRRSIPPECNPRYPLHHLLPHLSNAVGPVSSDPSPSSDPTPKNA